MTLLRTLLVLSGVALPLALSNPHLGATDGNRDIADWAPLIGWYQLDEGREALLTWGAQGGLRLAGLEGPYFAHRFEPQPEGSFHWTPKEGPARTVNFAFDKSGEARTFHWTNKDNDSSIARRIVDQPYSLRELEYRNEDVSLSGTLLIPESSGPLPAAAMIHGSGESDRDNLWYLAIADHLARNGVAVLLPDKRGCGKSGGDWTTSSMDDFAADTRA